MGFVATEVAQGVIAAGSSGDNTVYTVPGSTTAHILHMTLLFADSGDSATVKAGPSGSERGVATASPTANGDVIDCAASRLDPGTESKGTIGNKIIETGGKIIINKTGTNGSITYSISAYEIT